MASKPFSQFVFITFPTGYIEHELDHLRLCSDKTVSIKTEKNEHRQKRKALITIDKGMITGQAIPVGRRKVHQVGTCLIMPAIRCFGQSRFQKSVIA